MLFYLLLFFGLTIIGLPLYLTISQTVKYQTLVYAKLLGFSFWGLVVWMLGSFHLLPANRQNLLLIYGLLLVLSLIWIFFHRHTLNDYKKFLKRFLKQELMFILVFLLFLWARSFNQQIQGTEKFMDMALLSASQRSEFFPFADFWQANLPVNYYYFGQLLLGFLAKAAGTNIVYAYNLSLAFIFTLSLTTVYGLGRQFTTRFPAAVAAFLAVLAGNMFFAICALKNWFGFTAKQCYYAVSTRLFDPSYIINEIPSYSFTVGDLHAHLIAFPFLLLGLYLLWQFSVSNSKNFWLMLLIGLSFGLSALINTTDAVTLSLVFGLLIIAKAYPNIKQKNWKILWQTNAPILISVIVALLIYLPFFTKFHSPILGIGFSPKFASANALWGNFHQYPTPVSAQLGIWGALLAILLWAFYKQKKGGQKFDEFIKYLALGSGLLLILIELFFVKDIYHIANPPFFRANTSFKFGFHVWIMLSLCSAVAINLLLEHFKHKKTKKYFWLGLGIFLFLSFIYPLEAGRQILAGNKTAEGKQKPPTLDGIAYLKLTDIGDYEAINWINRNIKGRETLLEAAGDSYSKYGRISAFTGLPNPINWLSHEWTWRFKVIGEVPAYGEKKSLETGYGAVRGIANEVQQFYETGDLQTARGFLEKYHIRYVYLGNLEREAYPVLNLDKMTSLGKVIFMSGETFLWQIP